MRFLIFTVALIGALIFLWRAYRGQQRWLSLAIVIACLVVGARPARDVWEIFYYGFSVFTQISIALIAVGVVGLVLVVVAHRSPKRRIQGLFSIAAGGLFVVSGGMFWYTHRPLPPAIENQRLFEGITYTREVRRTPRPMVVHVVTINLDAPGLKFMMTPGTAPGKNEFAARTTSDFLDEFGLQLAINGSYFTPWHSSSPIDYYPHTGDLVSALGAISSQGIQYSANARVVRDVPEPIFYLSEDNQVSTNRPIGEIYNAINANYELLRNGRETAWRYAPNMEPRTAVAWDRTGRTLMFFVIDGRQPNYSDGASMDDLIEVIRDYGGYNALRLDGGGSSTLVIQDESGNPLVLNSPIHSYIPGLERPLATHIGIYALPVGSD